MRFKPGAAILLPPGVEVECISSPGSDNIMRFTATSPGGLSYLMDQFYEPALGDEFREAVRSAVENNN